MTLCEGALLPVLIAISINVLKAIFLPCIDWCGNNSNIKCRKYVNLQLYVDSDFISKIDDHEQSA